MTDPHPGPGKFFCAVLLACYGILAVTATGPHLHDPAWPASAAARSEPARVSLETPGAGDPAGRAGALAHCWLCAWSRSAARPVWSSSIIESGPPAVAAAAFIAESPAESPVPSTVFLRAPPPA